MVTELLSRVHSPPDSRSQHTKQARQVFLLGNNLHRVFPFRTHRPSRRVAAYVIVLHHLYDTPSYCVMMTMSSYNNTLSTIEYTSAQSHTYGPSTHLKANNGLQDSQGHVRSPFPLLNSFVSPKPQNVELIFLFVEGANPPSKTP